MNFQELFNQYGSIVSLIVIVVVFYFLLIRPEQKRKKDITKMRNELLIGDEITTIGGIVGKIVTIKDDTVTIETGSDRTKVVFMRWAISSKGAQAAEGK